MVKHTIKMLQRASDDIDNIYNHIADDFKEIGTAEKLADALEDAILSLGEMPYRGSIRRTILQLRIVLTKQRRWL